MVSRMGAIRPRSSSSSSRSRLWPTASPGPVEPADALRIALQIAQALEAAHGQSVIHRDLKPANVKVRDDGTVKVLDFGLAKAFEPAQPAIGEAANSPTLTNRATALGVILGTAAYMAPEQAKGKPVDKRADIWAFGVVLCEMLSGRRLFRGEDVGHAGRGAQDGSRLGRTASLDAVRDSATASPMPRAGSKRRLHDIADARLEIEEALSAPVRPASNEPTGVSRRERLLWLVGLAGAAAASAATALNLRPAPIDPPERCVFRSSFHGQRRRSGSRPTGARLRLGVGRREEPALASTIRKRRTPILFQAPKVWAAA